MINFLLIGVCILAGMLFRQTKSLPEGAHKGINAWIIYLALPAVCFKYLPHIQWSKDLLLPALSPVIIWIGSWFYTTLYAAKNKIDKATVGGLKLTSGLSNTSFVGFPLIMAYFSERELSIAIICDQVTFTLLSTAGVIMAINSSGKHTLSTAAIAKKVFRFPPFLACVAALTIPRFINISFFDPFFDKLAATVAPLALFSIGLQLKFQGWKAEKSNLKAALFYKLFIAPALILAVVICFHAKGTTAQISIFEAAMPTLLTSGIVADEYGLNPKLSNLIIGIGIIASFATTAIWFFIIHYFVLV